MHRFGMLAAAGFFLVPAALAVPAAAPSPVANPIAMAQPIAAARPIAAPEPFVAPNKVEKRQLLGDIVDEINNIISNLSGDYSMSILAVLDNITPTTTPTSISQVQSELQDIFSATSTNLLENIAAMILDGLSPSDISVVAAGYTTGENTQNNVNPSNPGKTIYPKKSSKDAPYTLTEAELRKAIYIPSTFTYGKKPPLLMVPGTGSFGGVNFASNLRKLFTGTSFADPVWLNVPGAMLGDAQVNSEYVAYAINYISGISNRNISVTGWSQGGLDTQWAFTFWPSTRSVVTDFIPISSDFRGTVLANVLCLSANSEIGLDPCAPSIIQQEATADYISVLRSHGGGSAYVPTTTLYSGFFDEVVEPQQGTSASAYILDTRGVGVTNNEVQLVCPGQPAGGFYTHEGMLVNSITYALIVDALTHDGPGQTSRIDLSSVCQQIVAPGLTLTDVLATESLLAIFAALVLLYEPKLITEPPLMPYAQ